MKHTIFLSERFSSPWHSKQACSAHSLRKTFTILSLLVIGFALASCSDTEEYTAGSGTLLADGAVVTGSADVTPTAATLHGTVAGLDSQNPAAYSCGFYYGTTATELDSKQTAGSAADFNAVISGTNGQTIYYQAFVTLQNRLTYRGEVRSLVLTNAKATTGDVVDITANTAHFKATFAEAPADAECGIILRGGQATDEQVRAGVRLPGLTAADINVEALGLLPNTHYSYAAYLDLGKGVVYGDTRVFNTPAQQLDFDTEFVDLGLSTKWARCNIGATAPEQAGARLAFGDLTGYNTSIEPGDYASDNIYKTDRDIASLLWNGRATLPTIDEYEELFRCCRTEWATEGGVQGYRCTGPNGNSIFLPAAGSRAGADTAGDTTEGRYLSGSINTYTDAKGETKTDGTLAMSYLFNGGGSSRATTPVYQAMSARAVSTAKNIKLDRALLCNTWEIDLTTDGSYQVFHGPTYFYGDDASWRTVTNHEPLVGVDPWCWDADFAGNSWAVGGSALNCQGSITFREDGTVTVVHRTADGVETTENGTYTVNEEAKTITLTGATMLAPANFTAGYTDNLTTDIRILSLTAGALQFAVPRTTSEGGLLSINMIPALVKNGYNAKLTCYGAPESQSDAWSSATITIPGGDGMIGQHTITFNTTEPRTNGKVYVIDIEKFGEKYPNAVVRVDDIQADGVSVPFDQSKFYFGNIEGNGNFRIEMANIWGCGHNDSWDGLGDTPFHLGGGATTDETALAFQHTFAVTFTIVSTDALAYNVKQTVIGLDPGWAQPGNWGNETPAALTIALNADTHRYEATSPDPLALTLTAPQDTYGGPAPSNGAVNLVDIMGVANDFPGFAAQLISVDCDGSNVPFDATKLKTGDLEGNGNFRIELHNIWGATAADPAFAGAQMVEGNNCVTSLGFHNSTTYTIGRYSLYASPWK